MSDEGRPTPFGRLGHAAAVVRDVGPSWAYERAREVLKEEGVRGVMVRGRRSVDTRRALEDRAQQLRANDAPASRSAFRRSVLIITDIAIPQCRYYRVDQKVELLSRAGLTVRVVSQDHVVEALARVQLAGAVILYRAPWSRHLDSIVSEARRVGARVVFETDDAVYRRDLLKDDPNVRSLPRPVQLGILRGADRFLRTLNEADASIASTPRLAADMGRITGRPSFVIPNSIDSRMQATLRGIAADPRPTRAEGSRTIFYGSGSKAHDEDFALAVPGLLAALRDHSDVRLVIGGTVAVPESLLALGDRLERLEPMTFAAYLRRLSVMDVSLAPLLDSPFNGFKSDIKFLEASLVGVPSVVSPTVYGDSVVDGVSALVARTPVEWHDRIARLLDEPALGRSLVTQARASLADRRVDLAPSPEIVEILTAVGLEPHVVA